MIKKWNRNLIFICISVLTLGFLCLNFNCTIMNVYASEEPTYTYIALGDSITEGFAYDMKTITYNGGDRSVVFNENYYLQGYASGDQLYSLESTTSSIYAYKLSQKMPNNIVASVNFAESGDTCEDLLNFISSFYNSSTQQCVNPNSQNSVYPSLTNQEVYDYFKSAKYITMNIGSNNILSEAPSLISKYWGLVANESITISEIETILKNKIVGADNPASFEYQFSNLLTELDSLTPNAEIYVSNIYNPYKALTVSPELESAIASLKTGFAGQMVANMGYTLNITQSSVKDIADLSELAIAGGVDSDNQQFTGLNNIIQTKIEEFCSVQNSQKFKFVDIKTHFDKIYNDTNKNYNDYINEEFSLIKSVSMSDLATISSTMAKYMDPHPTSLGQSLIADAFIEEIDFQNQATSPTDPDAPPVIDTPDPPADDPASITKENTTLSKSQKLKKYCAFSFATSVAVAAVLSLIIGFVVLIQSRKNSD